MMMIQHNSEGVRALLGSKWIAPEEEYVVQEVEVSAIVDIKEQKVEDSS